MKEQIDAAVSAFEKIISEQLERIEKMKRSGKAKDFLTADKIIIGVCYGDGIGPVICRQTERVLKKLLKEETEQGIIEFRTIQGLTIENRIACGKAIPDDVLEELLKCDVILKGPTTTPDAGQGGPNIESANVAMRRSLDLFANVRPVRVPEKGIDWTFFRENTEGGYAVGSKGVELDGLSVDFTVTTDEGTLRIARAAYEYAKNNGKKHVSIVTKANVIKATDGKFLRLCKQVGEEYPGITTDSWYADIVTAKLIDEKRRKDFEVFVLPNLYGDIITDEAAEFQGGVGTAGSANIGTRYAMFEAIHGSAPRMVEEGRGKYADPCSMLRAAVMLLDHIGRNGKARALEEGLDRMMFTEGHKVITGRENGCTCEEFTDELMSILP